MAHLLHRCYVEAEGGALVVRCDCKCPTLLIWTDGPLPVGEVTRVRSAHHLAVSRGGFDFYVEEHANAGPGVDLTRGAFVDATEPAGTHEAAPGRPEGDQ